MNFRKQLHIIILICFTSFVGKTQSSKLDSIGQIIMTKSFGEYSIPGDKIVSEINAIISHAASDSILFKAYDNLNFFYEEYNIDSALYYAEKALQVARRNNQLLAEAGALYNRAICFRQTGKFGLALEDLLRAFDILNTEESVRNSWKIFSNYSLKDNRIYLLSVTHHVYALLMESIGNTEAVIYHYQEEIRLAESIGSSFRKQLAYMNLAGIYLSINKLDTALMYGKLAENEGLRTGERIFLGWTYSTMGKTYQNMGEDENAIQYFHKSIDNSKRVLNFSTLTIAYYNLAEYYLTINNPDSSLFYSNLTLDSYNTIGSWNSQDLNLGNVYKNLYKSFDKKNQIDSAYKYAKLAFETSDSLNNFKINSLSNYQNLSFQEQQRIQKIEEEKILYENKVKFYSLLFGLLFITSIAIILFRGIRQRAKINRNLIKQKTVLENTLDKLKATQNQLIHAEKMASLGELTAGIAHEIQNPLNFVNNFSEVSTEMIDELEEELEKKDINEIKVISKDLKQNLEKIHHHGKRAESIVNGMLLHSRTNKGEKALTDINGLCDEFLRLAYHGLRAKDRSFNAEFEMDFDDSIPKIEIVPQDVGRVLLNIINNAFQACSAKTLQGLGALEGVVNVTTKNLGDKIQITISDNGPGIPDDIKEKIFQPFFTTKPTGQGTGLGLSLAYDIVKSHGGEIKMNSTTGSGTTFIISLPMNKSD